MPRTPSKKAASVYPSPPSSPYTLCTPAERKTTSKSLPTSPTKRAPSRKRETKATLQEELKRLTNELKECAKTEARQDELIEQLAQEVMDKEEELDWHRQLQPVVETAIEYAEKSKDLIAQREYMLRQKAILTCGGCSKLFSNPQQLDCGHVFCAKCLDDWCYNQSNKKKNPRYKGEPLTCPQNDCRKEVVFGPIAAPRVVLEVARFSKTTGIQAGESWPCLWPTQELSLVREFRRKQGA
ncbi:RING finger protein 39 [Marasmius tenuissimus]|uniref:RING finger protein 39 n=1 Tax=Marasmius tenuissimus TaxID=585030 RepID=A0ABR2ZSD1_9AGAR